MQQVKGTSLCCECTEIKLLDRPCSQPLPKPVGIKGVHLNSLSKGQTLSGLSQSPVSCRSHVVLQPNQNSFNAVAVIPTTQDGEFG